MPDVPPIDLCDAIAKGRALIVCGAGVSSAATGGKAPGWVQLIREALVVAAADKGRRDPQVACCKPLLRSKQAAHWLAAADTIQAMLGGPSGLAYRDFFVRKLSTLAPMHREILEAIKNIAAAQNRIATTNYDHLISEALGWDRTNWTDHLRVVEALRDERPAVWHIHGDFDQPNSIIFSQSDYDRITASELPQFLQKYIGLDFTLIFVGCSGSGLSDDNVGPLLEWLNENFAAGLGDKHFVLIADNNKNKWPKGVTPVRFGDYPDLPAYLAKLAPQPIVPSSFPPDPKMIGRKDRLDELVNAILQGDRPIVVPGALGMGKTTLAVAAAYDPRVIERFSKSRRFFVNLEPAPDADGLLRRLAADFGFPRSGAAPEVEARIAGACAHASTLAILDNLETPWRKDRAATEALLGRLAAIEGLRLVITVRGETPYIPSPGACTLRDIERLEEDEARALFLRRAGEHFAADPALRDLLTVLDRHPLSIELHAGNATGRKNLRELASDWNKRRGDLWLHGAAKDRRTSLRASLELSLAALDPPSPPHRLIRLLALLPDGMSEADACTTLADGEPTNEERRAAARLEAARLASRPDDRWRLLAPIRETLLAYFPPEPDDRERLIKLFLPRAANGGNVGTDRWGEARDEVIAEAGNLDAIVAVALRELLLPEGAFEAVWGLGKFYRMTGLASIASLAAAPKRFRDNGDERREANCFETLGDIALDRSNYEEARKCYGAALALYRKFDDVLGQPNCIRGLGDVARALSEYEEARQRYEAALPLYEEVDEVLGKAACIEGLGDLALERSAYEEAGKRYEAALVLYKQVDDAPGQANCVGSLGDIAFDRSDYEEARKRFESALSLYNQVGDVPGEAFCIEGLGDVALERFEYEEARQRYETALPLHKQVGSVLGEADCIQGLGDVEEARGEIVLARERWREALALYARIPAPYSIGFAHNRLARRAATPEEAAEHRKAAGAVWASIDRPDLIAEYLGRCG